jgi:peroxiredoxin
MRVYIILFLLLSQLCLQAQIADSVKIIGKVGPDSGVTWIPDKADMRLVPYNEGENIYLTSVNSDGTFSIKVAVNNTGLYDLKYKGYKVSLLLTPAEPFCKVIIKTDAKQDVHLMKISGSRENDAYRIFKRESIAFRDLMRDIKTECAANEKNCEAKFKKQFTSQNELMEYLKSGYKGTYTANVLADLGEVPELTAGTPLPAQLQATFFDAANLTDSLLYRTPDLNNKISAYLDFVADTTAPGRLQFIQHLMDRVKGKKEAQKGLLTTLFNNFLDDYREPFIQSLVQWANSHASLGNDQPVLAAKIKLVANLLPGLPAPDVTGENLDQQTQNLLATAKNNQLTVLIFWESDCPHCRKAMPDFIRLYNQYHAKGLEVFAVSLDSNKDKWKLFIANNHLTWTNIVLPDNSSAHADYFIQYTPTVVLIDNKGHIVKRFMSVEDLGKNIAAVLGD